MFSPVTGSFSSQPWAFALLTVMLVVEGSRGARSSGVVILLSYPIIMAIVRQSIMVGRAELSKRLMLDRFGKERGRQKRARDTLCPHRCIPVTSFLQGSIPIVYTLLIQLWIHQQMNTFLCSGPLWSNHLSQSPSELCMGINSSTILRGEQNHSTTLSSGIDAPRTVACRQMSQVLLS